MKTKRAGILGVGAYLPEETLTNFDLEKIVETSDEWIRERTGIKERRLAKGEKVSDLAVKAAQLALDRAGVRSDDIEAIVVASASPEMIFPSTACLVQQKLGVENNCASFDVQAACTGFNYALVVADSLIKSDEYDRILVIGAEVFSSFLDWSDRNTCVLFGDGAGAVVMGQVQDGSGILSSYLAADGTGADLLKIPAGGSGLPASQETLNRRLHYVKMNGREVFKWAVKALQSSIKEVLKKADLSLSDIDYFLFHQANKRIIEAATRQLGILEEKVPLTLDHYGNVSAASIPITLNFLYENGQLKEGNLVLMAGFGGGFTWGSNLVKWGSVEK
jgi:3-oxoacyl-[acyl-carrier-protein] synthase-3